MKKRYRQKLLILVFIAALFSTFSSISNMTIMDLDDWIAAKFRDPERMESVLAKNKANLHEKSLNVELAQQTYVSSLRISKAASSGEIDVTQYPSHEVVATGYTAGVESTGKTPDHPLYGITFSGVEVQRDVFSTIAADLEVFPLGTILFIPGYGYGVVADKGSAIQGKELDLYFPTVEDVYEQWGKRSLDVYVIKKGSGSLTEEELAQLNEHGTMKVFDQQE